LTLNFHDQKITTYSLVDQAV